MVLLDFHWFIVNWLALESLRILKMNWLASLLRSNRFEIISLFLCIIFYCLFTRRFCDSVQCCLEYIHSPVWCAIRSSKSYPVMCDKCRTSSIICGSNSGDDYSKKRRNGLSYVFRIAWFRWDFRYRNFAIDFRGYFFQLAPITIIQFSEHHTLLLRILFTEYYYCEL